MSKEVRKLLLVLVGVLILAAAGYFLFLNSQPKYVSAESATLAPAQMPVVGNLAAAHSFSTGPLDAKVTVVEFFDPECEACAAVAPTIEKEMKHYQGRVRWVFRYMAFHHNSKNAIKILEAARKQNQFLELQHLLFSTQNQWGEKQTSTEDDIIKIAATLKSLNMNLLKKDMDAAATENIIQKDASEGQQAGVRGTPTFFVNGVLLEQLNLDLLISRIEEGLK